MIIAIDPGSEQSAFVRWNGGKILEKGKISNNAMLGILYEKNLGVSCLVIEMIGHYGKGMPAGKTVFDTCLWIGRFIQKWLDSKNPLQTYGEDPYYCLVLRGDIKLYLCGNARAKDPNIRQALIDRFGPPGTIKAPNLVYAETNKKQDKMAADLWQALAVAVYWWNACPIESRITNREVRAIEWPIKFPR